jgi:hypothetical protein
MDYQRLYEFRFRDVDQQSRERVWEVIADDIYRRMGGPKVVLDPAAGRCEFINAIPATEKWVIDKVDHGYARGSNVKVLIADVLSADLPDRLFDGVFVSNFLEHLPCPDAVAAFLERMRATMVSGGCIAVMGPNFKYCSREYFDCADHVLALTHVAVEEHLYAAGFTLTATDSRYLPFSFRGLLPPSPLLTALYLRVPLARKVLGKQFLVLARA